MYKLKYLEKRYKKMFTQITLENKSSEYVFQVNQDDNNKSSFSLNDIEQNDTKYILSIDFNSDINFYSLTHLFENFFYNKNIGEIDLSNIDDDNQQRIIMSLINGYVLSASKESVLLDSEYVFSDINIISSLDEEIVQRSYLLSICELIAKDLTNLPPNYLRPADFKDFVLSMLQDFECDIEVISDFEKEELNLMNKISSSSSNEGYVLKLTNNNNETNVIAGKGVCYDTGGYSLKYNNGMRSMKGDMGGAAVAFAIFLGNQILGNNNTNVYLGLTQNMLNNNALLPDDVISYDEKTTIEIGNTDAEGRLVIADLIKLINKDNNDYKNIITLATLTDIAKSIGRHVTPCFTSNANTTVDIIDKGYDVNEFIWPMPLDQFNNIYANEVKNSSQIATVCNNSRNSEANSIYAANFMHYFVKNKDASFLSFDLGCTGWRNNKAHAPMVKTLINYLEEV